MRIEFVKEEYTRDDVPIACFDISEDLTKEEEDYMIEWDYNNSDKCGW